MEAAVDDSRMTMRPARSVTLVPGPAYFGRRALANEDDAAVADRNRFFELRSAGALIALRTRKDEEPARSEESRSAGSSDVVRNGIAPRPSSAGDREPRWVHFEDLFLERIAPSR